MRHTRPVLLELYILAIAESLNIAEPVVCTAMVKLEKSKFFQKLGNSQWLLPPVSLCVNPNAMEKQKTHPVKPVWLCSMDEFLKVDSIVKRAAIRGVAVCLAAHSV